MSTDKLFISFMCFWESFDPNNNVYVDLLRKHYDVVVITDKSEYRQEARQKLQKAIKNRRVLSIQSRREYENRSKMKEK